MARIKLSSLLADLRGRYGTTLFSSNGAGFYARPIVIPRNPRTIKQQTARGIFSSLISQWNALETTDKALWTIYAARPDNERLDWFGDPYYPSNRAQFISLNTLRLTAGYPPVDVPPTTGRPDPLPQMKAMFSPAGAPDDSYIDAPDPFQPNNAFVAVYLSAWLRPGRLTPVTPPRWLGLFDVADFGPINVQTAAEALFPYGSDPGRFAFWFSPVSPDFRIGTQVHCTEAFDSEAYT